VFDLIVSAFPHRQCTRQQSRPSPVSVKMRLRRSDGSCDISTNPRRSRGFNAAVNVVRSIASKDATGPWTAAPDDSGHQERKLPIGKCEWAQDFVETPRQSARRALHVEAETAIPGLGLSFRTEAFFYLTRY